MHEAIRVIHPVGDLNDPVFVVGFAVRQRAGRLAHVALSYLIEAWHAEAVAEIDLDDFLDFTVRRPEQSRASGKVTIEWPRIQIFRARPPGATRDFLLLGGFEPNFRWPTLISALTEYMQSAGVNIIVSLRSFPGSVPHTRPAPVNLTASELELELQFGIQAEHTKYEGPADIAAVLGVAAQSFGCTTVELSVIHPYYVPRGLSSTTTMSLVKVLDHAFGLQTPIEALQAAIATEAKAIEESFANPEEIQTTVRELERSYDEGLEQLSFLSPATGETTPLPSGQELIEDIERFFREKEGSGD
jgi:predicted ATP-grasp superfamily ATP-dependent carboligase